ncbi:MAG: metal ABC transporter substrate-binding protein [Candidatus Puniceispirillum sp.]|nr:metal ABC transporter substrate-binding protein [Candidatus Puniceispirillum sp.]
MKKAYATLLCASLMSTAVFSAEVPLKVVASFSILGDLIKEVGGEGVDVTTIVGPNADAHVFEPTPQTGKLLVQADMLFINGLDFETWLPRLVEASNYRGVVVTASRGINPRTLTQDGKPMQDPHAWLSVPHARLYVKNIEEALCAKAPLKCNVFQERSKAYDTRLGALDQWIHTRFKAIPDAARVVITAHDAFSYFAKTYNVRVLAPQGINTQAEASAWDVAALIDQIRTLKVKTLFVENMASPKLIAQIAQETGARMGDTLYSDALSEKGACCDTYVKLMTHNVDLLAKAMGEAGKTPPPAN